MKCTANNIGTATNNKYSELPDSMSSNF